MKETIDSVAARLREEVARRDHAEQALRDSEGRFRLLSDHAADAILVHDVAGRLLLVNRQACKSLGYTRDELLRLSVRDIEDHFDADGFGRLWERISDGAPHTRSGIHRRKDGTTFPVEVRVTQFAAPGAGAAPDDRRLVLALARDVSERVQSERALRRAYDEMETRVERRTAELAAANAAL